VYTDNELKQMIHDADTRAYAGRFERLRFLLSQEDAEPSPVSALAREYYEEARLCWYIGAFVTTIVLTQLCFEELLRSHYRVSKGVSGYLNEHLKIDDAGFKALIDQARTENLLSTDEFNALNRVRRDFRNPYVHVHDFKVDNDFSKPNFMKQYIKITAPELVDYGVEDEAREAISSLVGMFRKISRRFFPIL